MTLLVAINLVTTFSLSLKPAHNHHHRGYALRLLQADSHLRTRHIRGCRLLPSVTHVDVNTILLKEPQIVDISWESFHAWSDAMIAVERESLSQTCISKMLSWRHWDSSLRRPYWLLLFFSTVLNYTMSMIRNRAWFSLEPSMRKW